MWERKRRAPSRLAASDWAIKPGNLSPPGTMLSYHKRKRRQRKKWKKIFLLSALRIPCLLLHTYTADTRCRFEQDHPYLGKLYQYLLELLSKELKLAIKRCRICRIKFLPNHRTKGRQKCCPYGCVELNRKINRQSAKNRYRQKHEAKMLASQYNCLYRERRRNGQIYEIPKVEYDLKGVEVRLRREIKFLYKKLNPEVNSKKLKRLDRILQKLSYRISIA